MPYVTEIDIEKKICCNAKSKELLRISYQTQRAADKKIIEKHLTVADAPTIQKIW
jgi:LEA14-like dessication related protein